MCQKVSMLSLSFKRLFLSMHNDQNMLPKSIFFLLNIENVKVKQRGRTVKDTVTQKSINSCHVKVIMSDEH